MKKIFTLMTFVCTSMIATNSFAQISKTFETQSDYADLINECWRFTTVDQTDQNPLDGIGSVISQANSISQITTPFLNLGSSVTVSFMYQRVQVVTGGSKTLKIILLDSLGNRTVFETIMLNDGNVNSFTQTYTNANTPGNHFPMFGKLLFEISASAVVAFDDLNISAPYRYFGGCEPFNSPLPVKLINFQGNKNENKVSLQWTDATNETADRFEIERSLNGTDFTTAGIIMTDDKPGAESYSFKETVNSDKVFYRLKMYDKSQAAEYSKTLVFQSKSAANANMIKVINNPVADKLTISFNSSVNQAVDIKVHDISGRTQMTKKMSVYAGSNLISLSLNSNFKTGVYIVEVNNGTDSQIAKFVKQ